LKRLLSSRWIDRIAVSRSCGSSLINRTRPKFAPTAST
jgi:hypothetical protein